MSDQTDAVPDGDKRLFWACFIALIATAFGFIVRALVIDDWAAEFNLTETQKGEIFGVGLWPFAISIVLFSLIIDKIGYGRAMVFAFLCHVALIDSNSRAVGLFGVKFGDTRGFQQALHILAIIGCYCNSQAGVEDQIATLDSEWGGEFLHQTLGHQLRRPSGVQLVEDDSKFVSSQSRYIDLGIATGIAADRITVANRVRQAPGHLNKQLVASTNTQRVVNSLEIVQVDKQQGQGMAIPLVQF